MYRFKEFLLHEDVEGNYGLNNDAKGKLHELLVGKYLVNPHAPSWHDEKHHGTPGLPKRPNMLPGEKPAKAKKGALDSSPEETHDRIAKSISKSDYAHHDRIARSAAKAVSQRLVDDGIIGGRHSQTGMHNNKNAQIRSVHWTSNPKDVERLTGKSVAGDNADIAIKVGDQKSPKKQKSIKSKTGSNPNRPKLVATTTNGGHVGISLKIHKKMTPSTLANWGVDSAQQLLHHNRIGEIANEVMDKVHNIAHKKGLKTRDMPLRKAHEIVKTRPDILEPAKKVALQGGQQMAGEIRKKLKEYHPNHLTNLVRNLANVKATSFPTYRGATYGHVDGKMTHEVVDPIHEANTLLDEHKDHLHVGGSGSNINFYGKPGPNGKPQPLGSISPGIRAGTPWGKKYALLMRGWTHSAKTNMFSDKIHALASKVKKYVGL